MEKSCPYHYRTTLECLQDLSVEAIKLIETALWNVQSERLVLSSVPHPQYLANILPNSFQIRSSNILSRSCRFWQDLRRNPRWIPKSCQDIQDGIQDLVKISEIVSKNIFVEHVVLLQEFKIFLRSWQDQGVKRWAHN